MPTLDKEDPAKIFALFKGEPGTRKSTQALSFILKGAKQGKQKWFSWDRKMQGIIVPARKWGVDLTRVNYEDYDDWNVPKAELDKLALNCDYDDLIFDSVTSMADMTLRQTLKSKAGVKRGTGKDAGMMIAGIPINEMEDYNAESSALNDLIARCKDIQDYNYKQGRIVNIILIAHVMEVSQKEGSKTTKVRTIVTAGKRAAAKLPAYCSEVYHFDYEKSIVEGGEGDLIIHTQNTGDDFARTALNLDRTIKIGDKPLYRDFIKPAIDKLKKPTNDLTI